MSSSFFVYPGDPRIPSFQEVCDLGNARIKSLLSSRGIDYFVPFDYRFGYDTPDRRFVRLKAPEVFRWRGDDVYAWLWADGGHGQTSIVGTSIRSGRK